VLERVFVHLPLGVSVLVEGAYYLFFEKEAVQSKLEIFLSALGVDFVVSAFNEICFRIS